VAKPDRPERDDLRSEADMLMDELPDETAGGRMVRDDGEPADEDQYLADRDEIFAQRLKKGNQAPPNPPKR
jgi:hypothetical protein